jgi:hypothetical protein
MGDWKSSLLTLPQNIISIFCNDFSAHQMHLPGDINGAAGFTNELDGHLA